MVDVLDHFPANHPGRDSIIQILKRFAKAIVSVQDKKSGLWYDVPDKASMPRNYPEASASSMLVYTLAKGVRKGYLPVSYLTNAKKAYDGIIRQFVKKENGSLNLHGTVAVSGLGGKPYRDGSFDYYMSEPVIVNDPKGLGAFINAANEMEMIGSRDIGKNKTVLLDYYFNNEWKKDVATGKELRWHYTWEDKSNSGFAMLGNIFNRFGAELTSLESAPTIENLDRAGVYIIVDPDTDKETANPNYITDVHANAIVSWVKDGGVLILLTNDKGNADLTHTNLLAEKFGIHFNEDNFNMVVNNQFEQGEVKVNEKNKLFKTARKLFIKELATLELKSPATPILSKEGNTIAGIASYGKGKVFIMGDPWLYNEYVDGRKLPAEFENYKAAEDLVKWVLQASKKK
jgi:unsaturated rhamnogalacturonyl hydrolase